MVAAARKYGRMVQTGTQRRSEDVSIQAAEYLRSGQLGGILYAHAIVYRRRSSIGRVDGPQPVPPTVNYDLWLGPAPMAPVMRKSFHYDWHWQWPTGNGEIGNNGVHQLDRCRWLIGQDKLPRRAIALGGRFLFHDDGQTPNTEITWLEGDPAPIFCEVRNLPTRAGSKKMDQFRLINMGLIVQCEGGAVLLGGKVVAKDNQGRTIKTFASRLDKRTQAIAHQVNFIEAVRSRDRNRLRAEVLEGHRSAALCHMANVSYRLGKRVDPDVLAEAAAGNATWQDMFERFRTHLEANGVDLRTMPAVRGPWVTLDPDREVFTGALADRANQLSHRPCRPPFIFPKTAG